MKVLYVANIHRHFIAFHTPYIKWLKDKGFIVHVAANGEENVPYVDKQFNIPIERSPYKVGNLKAYHELKNLIEKERYDIVHCHTPMGGVLGRLASRKIRKSGTTVIYTSHGFHFCKGGPLLNWILYYPVERFMAKLTDVIITINNEDFKIAQKFGIKKHYRIPGIGLDINKFKNVKVNIHEKRKELNISDDSLLLISVGDLTKRKNHEVVIKAISKMKDLNLKYLICGNGELENYLKQISKKLNVSDKVVFLGYRDDVKEILKASDIFIFPSLWEGLGIAGIEAMAVGIPIIASNRHGILDYAINNETAILCNPKNEDDIASAIKKILDDKKLAKHLTENAYEIINKFDLTYSLSKMEEIYEEILQTK